MGSSQRLSLTGSQHSVGLQLLLDPASGFQEGEEERKRVICKGIGVLPRATSSYEVGSSSKSNSKHRIFLSYSRSQLDFVTKLCEDLEDRHRFPFLDIRRSSLPLGERFEDHLLKAAQQCSLAVVVVSAEYFSSEWPMRELVEFVRAKSGSNPNMKILPLFFKLSIRDLRDESKQERWFEGWAKWAEASPWRVNVAEYKEAFEKVKAFNGIQFNQDMMELGSYQNQVVRGICSLVSPEIKLYDGHVQGIRNMYEDYIDKIEGIEPSGTFGVRVIGYYGVGGIGKTTMCKTLCNALSLEFEDKVCHVELTPSLSSSQKLLHSKEVLKKLTSTSDELLQGLNEDQCKDVMCKSASWRQKAFLALDNVWDDSTSIEYVRMFIREVAFGVGSVVMVTARSLTTLRYLGLDSAQCFEVPKLSIVDARNLFLFHAVGGRRFDSKDDINMVDECVVRCYFRRSEMQGSHYLPLALKVLGMHLGSLGKTPQEWLDNLRKVRDFDLHSPSEDNPVFSVIRLNYDRLYKKDQALFMDISVYLPMDGIVTNFPLLCHRGMWLGLVHRKRSESMIEQLHRLKEKGLLEDLDLSTGNFSMHDLYREFAIWESQGKSNREGFNVQRWMYEYNSYPSTLERRPPGEVWENLIRVLIQEDWYNLQSLVEGDGILSLQAIQWRYCSNIVVLKLCGLINLRGVLNLKDLYCLRSLELMWLRLLDGVEGLEDLKNLTFFQWWIPMSTMHPLLGQLPASLKVFLVEGVGAKLRRDTFSRCTNLRHLKLESVEGSDGVCFDQCTSLEFLELAHIGARFSARKEQLDLRKLTRLQVLRIECCFNISKVCGLDNLQQLRELRLEGLEELPNLSGLQNLHHLSLRCHALSSTLDFGKAGLPLLRHLDLGFSLLEELPNLSKMTALEELDIERSSIKLQEEDIVMLAKLPKLHPVKISSGISDVKLDVVKRTLKKRSSFLGVEYEDSNIGSFPIDVGHFYRSLY